MPGDDVQHLERAGAINVRGFWATFLGTVAGLLLLIAAVLIGLWLYLHWTLPDCGLCDDAASSVSRAPGS